MVQRYVFDEVDDPRLHALVVWGPMLGGEERSDALTATPFLDDARSTHLWTSEHDVAEAFRGPAGLPPEELAWDTFLLYAPGTTWSDEPPAPDLVMHYGKSLPEEQRLHGPTLRQAVERLLSARGLPTEVPEDGSPGESHGEKGTTASPRPGGPTAVPGQVAGPGNWAPPPRERAPPRI